MPADPPPPLDSRLLAAGRGIPSRGYADQPYLVRLPDGAWLCALTTGPGHEGQAGQTVAVCRSTDQGRSWSELVNLEAVTGPEASYAVLLLTPGGRVYAFYNYNLDNQRQVLGEHGEIIRRVDSLGAYVFRYSDDGGRTWSADRHVVPVRLFQCDRDNVYRGAVRFFWNVGKPVVLRDGSVLMPHHKVAAMGEGFFAQSEGAFLRSDNILTERDPTQIRFATLPDGEVGLRAPAGGGRIAEEHSIVELSDGTIYCIFRTVAGYPACSTSGDGGRSWAPPHFLTYNGAAAGRPMKNPRAANFVWKLAGGRYLYWFHHHGGSVVRQHRPLAAGGAPAGDLSGTQLPGKVAAVEPWDPYALRNPAWLCAGREIDTPAGRTLHWSQPEILLYDDDPRIRMSYPDLLPEPDGRLFLSTTQKSIATLHQLSPALLDGLFAQHELAQVPAAGLLLDLPAPLPASCPMPPLPAFRQVDYRRIDYPSLDRRAGISLEIAVNLPVLEAGRVLLDSRLPDERGLLLALDSCGRLRLTLHDGQQASTWASDPQTLAAGVLRHVVIVIDGGPKIISFIVDGEHQDGGDHRQLGWGRFSPTLADVNGAATLRLDAQALTHLRLYGRALSTSEAVALWRAWRLIPAGAAAAPHRRP